MRRVISGLFREAKEYLKYFSYKHFLLKNPMHDDIFIVEFPKSGISWLSNILGNVELQLKNSNETMTFYNQHKYIVDVHQMRGASINRSLERTYIKSHSEYKPSYYFVIYLIRNPFDVMVSYYNFVLDLGYEGSFEQFVEDPDYGIEKWKKHVNSWLLRKFDAQRVHVLYYEELINDTIGCIKSLYKNFGLDISEDILSNAVERSNLKNMSASEEHYRENNPSYTMSFVGKNKKKLKSELLTKDVQNYIYSQAKEELSILYPDLKNKF